MARNEKLVSNVYRDGAPQGSAQLTILDTSTYPNYTVTYEDGVFGTRPDLNGLFQSWIYVIKLVPDRIIPGRKLYVRHSNGDLSKWGNAVPLELQEGRYYQHIVYPSYMPSFQPYGIDIEIFHDEAMQYRAHFVRANAQGVGSAQLTVKPVRTTGNQGVVYEGEEFIIQAQVYGGIQDNAVATMITTIDGLPATAANGHVVNDVPGTISLFQGNGSVRVLTKADNNPNTNSTIRVVIGDLVATIALQEMQQTSPNGRYHYQSNFWTYYLGAGQSKSITIYTAVQVPASSDWDPAAGGLTGMYIPTTSAFQWNVIDGGYGRMQGAVNYKAILTSWNHANYDRNSGYTSDPQSIIKGILDVGNGQVASAKGVIREFDGLRVEVLEEGMDKGVVLPRRKTKYRVTNTGNVTKQFTMLYGQMGFLYNNNPDSHGVRGATIANNVTIDGVFVNRPEQSIVNDGLVVIED